MFTFSSGGFTPMLADDGPSTIGVTGRGARAARVLARVGRLCKSFMKPEDPDPLRVRKVAGVLTQVIGVAFTLLWLVAFAWFDCRLAAVINIVYTTLCILNLGLFARTKNLAVNLNIAAGLVVAGVIGKRKFSYDLWGDAVNVAARMESTGIPGQIQISDATYRCIEGNYLVEEREPVAVKGRGFMRAYIVMGRVVPGGNSTSITQPIGNRANENSLNP
jgi:hypothetical protein